ncbi:biotin-dependent carboxyltransferase family protein [Budvicia diplopodorum]|uniref:5-oxoprolinase subunit C family protein n=1 Tax=Budvicia diplopodorum TaxID=1119056 RepID=UPI00135CA2F9|nr:biotin-dependent carboxyltransferase family protein [Budvicia diplopodorum]
MIHIVRAGRLNSVQDSGRRGYRHFGVCQSGALDRMALAIANLLVGNPRDSAAIEFILGPCEMTFASDYRIALTGANFEATLDNVALLPWWSVQVKAGQTLKLNAPRHGMRAYLAVSGGIDSAVQLASRATDMQAKFGGHQGRALSDGDSLCVGELKPSITALMRAAPFGVRPPYWYECGDVDGIRVRVVPGPEYSLFTPEAQQTFWNSSWVLTPQSNRMGFRLNGPVLNLKQECELLSHGVLPGVIQVPPAGQPIVLMADAQTTGGYPKIGVVIDADLARLAQLRFNRTVRFVQCDVAQAHEELRRNDSYLQQVEMAMRWLPKVK